MLRWCCGPSVRRNFIGVCDRWSRRGRQRYGETADPALRKFGFWVDPEIAVQKRRQAACATREVFVALGPRVGVVALGRLLVLAFLGLCLRGAVGLAIGNCRLGGLLPFGCDCRLLWL